MKTGLDDKATSVKAYHKKRDSGLGIGAGSQVLGPGAEEIMNYEF